MRRCGISIGMKKFETDKIQDLTEVFFAVIGGKPENIREIEEFMQKTPLNQLIFAADMERVLKYDGFFSDEVADAIYALLPVKIALNDRQNLILTPQAFRELNHKTSLKPASRAITISFSKATTIFDVHFRDKMSAVVWAIKEAKQKRLLREQEKAKEQAEQKKKQAELEKKLAQIEAQRAQEQERKKIAAEEAKLAEEKKTAERREKNRLRMRQYRAEHPEARKSYYKRLDTLSPEEQMRQRAANNSRNAVYREKNREKLRQSHNERRAKLKAENPELLKSLDKMHNESANRKETCRKYYQKHKAELALKAQANPMVKVYKQRYKVKKRLEKTGPILASLLQAILASKTPK